MESLVALAVFVMLGLPVAGLLVALFTLRRLGRLDVDGMRVRIERLEREIAMLRGQPSAAPAPAPRPAPPRAASPPPAPVPATPPVPPRPVEPRETLEVRIGARWATWVGVLAIVTAIGLLLRWSFEKGLIGPAARVVTGVVSGTALLVAGLVLRRRRDLPYLARGLAGGGLAILYLSVWASHQVYAFLDAPKAFAALVAVTLAGIAVSVASSSQATAVLAVLGGLVTPVLVSTDRPDERTLFVYLLVLGALVLGVARRRSWPALARLAWVGTVALALPVLAHDPGTDAPVARLVLLTLLFALYLAVPLARAWQERAPAERLDLALVVGNAMAYCGFAYVTLEWWRPALEGPWAIVAALAYVALGEAYRRRVPEDLPTVLVHHGAAVVLAGLAVPLVLDGAWVTVGWMLEGLVLLALAPLVPSGRAAFWGGLAAVGASAARVAIFDPLLYTGRTPVWNSVFASDLVAVAGIVLAGRIASRLDLPRFGVEGSGAALRSALRVLALALLVALLWREPTGLGPGLLLVALLLVTAVAARWTRDPALVVAVPLVGLVVAARVFAADADLAREAADRLLSAPALLRIGACAAMLASAWALRRDDATRVEAGSRVAIGSLAGAGLLGAFSLAWSDHLIAAASHAREAGDEALDFALRRRLQTGLSILWTLYAAATLGVGFARRSPLLRFAALGLFGIVVMKVFLVDLSGLPGVYRVLSFLVLGIVLLGVAFFYQRASRGSTDREK